MEYKVPNSNNLILELPMTVSYIGRIRFYHEIYVACHIEISRLLEAHKKDRAISFVEFLEPYTKAKQIELYTWQIQGKKEEQKDASTVHNMSELGGLLKGKV